MMSPTGFIGLRIGQVRSLAKWVGIVVPMAAVVGSLCALFLWALDRATQLRFDYPWLIYAMPIAGILMVLAYQQFGRSAEGGNNLIVEQIHEPGGGVPLRMAPLILVTTVLTHLVGGSAGREGTAVQLGGSIASAFAKACKLSPADIRILLMAGIAAGFGAVFGTPIAGAIFALEVLTIGRMQYEALLPCLMAAIAGDWSCHAWGIEHTHYAIGYLANAGDNTGFHLNGLLLSKVVIAGIMFGLAARFFSELMHLATAIYKAISPIVWVRPVIASAVLIGLVYLLGTREYLGLGVWSTNPADATIPGFFKPGMVDYWSWLWKTIFTVITLSGGFKGGEVTPLFFIGAALGNALAAVLGAPSDLFAGLGFVAVFAGATNTPLACMIMGIELFGSQHAVYFAVACFIAYLCSGHSSIYMSQRLGTPKTAAPHIPPNLSIRQLRELNTRATGNRIDESEGGQPLPQGKRTYDVKKLTVLWLKRFGASLGIVAALAGAWAGYLRLSGNFHAVEQGVIYRSAQLSGAEFTDRIAENGIRTIINLRGDNTGRPWYSEAMKASKAAGVNHVDLALSASKELTDDQITRLTALLKDSPKPILVHCEGGADRTGIASALYELLVAKKSVEQASRQLSFRYGHFPWLISTTFAMDDTFKRVVSRNRLVQAAE